MREKNFNTGLRGVLFEERHYARMGSAIWLYGWLVLRQTHQTGTTDWVLGGAPVSYREIEGETGFNRLERWMSVLRRNEYIETEAAPGGVIVRILKAKKHLQGAGLGTSNDVRRVCNFAETVRRVAERTPQRCVANRGETYENERIAARIGSSSVVRIKDNEQQHIHRAVEISTCLQSERPRAFPADHQNQVTEEIQPGERREFQQQSRNVAQNHDLKNSYSEKTDTTSQTHRCDQYGNLQHANGPIENQNQRPAESRETRPPRSKTFPGRYVNACVCFAQSATRQVRRELAVGTGPEVRRL
jgi:hypothetical protein